MIAACTTPAIRDGSMYGVTICGKPVGTSPMIGAVGSRNTPANVPMIKAARGGGSTVRQGLGQRIMIASDRLASARAEKLISASIRLQLSIEATGPPAVGRPKNGSV